MREHGGYAASLATDLRTKELGILRWRCLSQTLSLVCAIDEKYVPNSNYNEFGIISNHKLKW
jgi:hypothetical protein